MKKIHSNKYPEINEVIVMIEYLDIKDDLGKLWNFHEDTNLFNQDILFSTAISVLKEKGYNISEKHLKTSGLLMNRNFQVDHYKKNKKQEKAITPPYIIRSVNFENQDIQNLETLLSELNRPMSYVMSDLRSMVKNNYLTQTSELNFPENTAILIIQAFKPRLSLFKNINLGYGVSNSGNGAFVGVGNQSQPPSTNAYFIHLETGDLLWSNKAILIKESNKDKFFIELPDNKN